MEKYIYLGVGLLIGGVIVYLWLKQKFAAEKATLESRLDTVEQNLGDLENDAKSLKEENKEYERKIGELTTEIERKIVAIEGLERDVQKEEKRNAEISKELKEKTEEFNQVNKELASALANNQALEKNLRTQKKEIEELGKKFNTEFENIASKILKANTESFSETNKEKLKILLQPLDDNLKAFRTKVEEVYEKEAKQRFSLAEKVKELAEKSDKISQDAINLTNALKGEAKTQGRWGEMILENILEVSGLNKGQEYFMEYQLFGPDGKPLRSEVEGKKMRPDALVKYPDERNVIIDSKVSLNAYTRYFEGTTPEEQNTALEEHVKAIKNHIIDLSAKGYDDYDKALDFVMMFIPSEPAYIAAMQQDPNLWQYAYEKRILLMNPTNLITALKLIVDLWKREYQNQNAIAIAKRGELLYKKFVGFVDNLKKVGDKLSDANESYNSAWGQLYKGSGNLINQATELKELGNFQPKKELPQELIDNSKTE